jgi:hypothetical protein
MATPSPPHTRPLPLHLPHKHTLAQGSFGRSLIVRPPVLSLFVRSSDRSIVRPIVHGSFVRSFVHPNKVFFCRYAAEIPIVRSSDHSIVHRSFIVPIHRSFIVPIHRSFIRLFTITMYHYYSLLLFIVTIHR